MISALWLQLLVNLLAHRRLRVEPQKRGLLAAEAHLRGCAVVRRHRRFLLSLLRLLSVASFG